MIEKQNEFYEEVEKKVEKLLLGRKMNLLEMDSTACGITRNGKITLKNGAFKELDNIPIGNTAIFGYGDDGIIEGFCDIEFKILKKPEKIKVWKDMGKVKVEVVDLLCI